MYYLNASYYYPQPYVYPWPTPYYHYQPQNYNYNQHSYQRSHYKRQYPDVDPTMFNESAVEFQKLMKEASLITNKLADSKDFARKVMDAAQKSETEKVEELIKSTGITSKVDVYFNPDGIRLEMKSTYQSEECCRLTMSFKW